MNVEIFFDYICPYCEAGYRYFTELLPQYPQATPVYRPCEANPRSESPYGQHSDYAIQGMFFVEANGGDVPAYNEAVYTNVFQKRRSIEDADMLAECAEKAGVDPQAFRAALKNGDFKQQQLDANNYAYMQKNVYAIPVFIAEEAARLDAALGVGVTKEQVAKVLDAANR